jgi:uncharacterized OB-fold protein
METAIISEQKQTSLQGWVCPKCGRVLSPFTSECPCHNLNQQYVPMIPYTPIWYVPYYPQD